MGDIYVNDRGFGPAPVGADSVVMDMKCAQAPEDVFAADDGYDAIFIDFGSAHDGRGFSQARRLRELGYNGLIIARGAIIADQYRHARQSGFDGVLLTKAQATRMPEPIWQEQAQRVPTSYQERVFQR